MLTNETKERVTARQGRLHTYSKFDPKRTAFVVIDLQYYFTQPGYQSECSASRATFPVINRLAQKLRSAGGQVVWIQTCSDNADVFWSRFQSDMLTPERSARRLADLASDSEGFALAPGLDVSGDDLLLKKRFYSAFIQGSSDLHEILQSKAIETILIGGTATNVCCESTARDAMMLNYATIMVADALSAVTEAEHVQALQGWMLYFGDVLTADQVIDRLSCDTVAVAD